MKAWAVLSVMVLGVTALSPASDEKQEDNPPASSSPSPSPPTQVRILGIEEFMKNVDRYRGEVWVGGVVSTAAPKKKTLALIDTKEFKECGVTTCAAFTLPVNWDGDMPSVKDQVQVQGKVEEVDGKLIFVAKKVKKMTSGETK